MKLTTGTLALTALALSAGCGPAVNHNQAVYVLVDTSGTYTKEVNKAQGVVNYLLGSLESGDSLAVATIKSRSFSEKDIVAKATFDTRPSHATTQKRAFKENIAAAFRGITGSSYTDITGGLLQGAEYLNETGAGTRTMIVFSDMQEELGKGTKRDFQISLKNIRVVAVNVVKLDTDNADPRRYLGRLDAWEKRVREAGASEWLVINDLQRLDRMLVKA